MTAQTVSGARSPLLEWAVAERALPGQALSGDSSVVVVRPDGVLIAVADGLGHGPEAAAASQAAVETIEANPDAAPHELMELCHERLRRTRGAALSIAVIDAQGLLSWAGIGNVEGRLFRRGRTARGVHEAILLRGGIVGYQLPAVRVTTHPVAADDVLVLVTDGIRSGYGDALVLADSASEIANDLLARHCRDTDDALVLVARCRGVM